MRPKFIALFGLVLAVLLIAIMLPIRQVIAQTDVDPTDQSATVQAAIETLLTATAVEEGVAVTATFEAEAAQATQTAVIQATTLAETQAASTPDLTQTIDAGLQGTVVAITQEARFDGARASLVGSATALQYIPGGAFEMGTTLQEVAEAVRECVDVYNANCQLSYGEDSIPVHNVMLYPYQIDVFEVSYLQFVSFLNAMGSGSHIDGCNGQACAATVNEDPNSPINFNGERYTVAPFLTEFPATYVTWHGAAAYCEVIDRRLPTEAEWEYAARGADGRIYPWGNTFDTTLARTRADDEVGAEQVFAYLDGRSPFNVINMAGNAAEWVHDWYAPDTYGNNETDNPTGPENGTERVVRGGSWDAMPFFARSVHRQYLEPGFAAGWVGFRCAADADENIVPRNVTLTPVPSPSPTATPND